MIKSTLCRLTCSFLLHETSHEPGDQNIIEPILFWKVYGSYVFRKLCARTSTTSVQRQVNFRAIRANRNQFRNSCLKSVQSGYLLPTRFEQPYESINLKMRGSLFCHFTKSGKQHVYTACKLVIIRPPSENGTRQRDLGQRSDPSACNPP